MAGSLVPVPLLSYSEKNELVLLRVGLMELTIDRERAIARLMRFLAVEGITGQEAAIGRAVEAALSEAGVPRAAIRYDTANQRIPLPTQTGNLLVDLPGTKPGPRFLFMTHLDTVPLCAGAKPVRQGERIVPAGKTALGGDNRTGVAALVTLAATLLERKIPHPPLTLLFTVREESGLFGAKYLDPADLGGAVMGFNVDGRLAHDITVGAVGAERWEVEITGKAAHAGVRAGEGHFRDDWWPRWHSPTYSAAAGLAKSCRATGKGPATLAASATRMAAAPGRRRMS